LPVPDVKNGKNDQMLIYKSTIDYHYSKGENTVDNFQKISIPVAKNVSLELFLVSLEYYKTDTIVRDLRASRERNPEGFTIGDLNITTNIQILQQQRLIPDLQLSINLRTASGGHLTGARYTDAPGYYFALSSGKNFAQNKINLYAQGGFYVWQTNNIEHPQNDAYLWGIGLDIYMKKIQFINQIKGYSGYMNNGDKPIIQKLQVNYLKSEKINFSIEFEKAWRDYPNNTISFTTKLLAKRK